MTARTPLADRDIPACEFALAAVLASRTVPTLHIRNVPPDVYERLRARAARARRSINAEAIAIFRDALERERTARDALERLERWSVELTGDALLPEEIVREERDGRF